MSTFRALLVFIAIIFLAGGFTAFAEGIDTGSRSFTSAFVTFAASFFEAGIAGDGDDVPVATAISVSNPLAWDPMSPILDLSGHVTEGTVEVYLWDQAASGASPAGGASNLISYETSDDSIGDGLNPDGTLSAGGTWTFLLTDLLVAAGWNQDFTGFGWIVANFDGVAASHTVVVFGVGFSEAFHGTPAIGQGFSGIAGLCPSRFPNTRSSDTNLVVWGGFRAPPPFLPAMKPQLNWTHLTCACALAGGLLLSCSEPAEPLEKLVTDFWAALIAQDRVSAQRLVAPASRNNFLRHRARLYRSCEIQDIREKSDHEMIVRVGYEGFFEELRQYKEQHESQLWRKIDGEWFLQVDPPEKRLAAAFEKIYSQSEDEKWSTDKNGQVTVGEQIKIPFFNQAQLGTLTIRNGTGEPVRVVRVELDEALIEITEDPGQIPFAQKRHLKVVHLGTDELKNQKSPMTVVIEQRGELREHPVEILYNYLSPGLRGILRLTTDQIAGLKRSDRVSPAISIEVPPEQAAEVQKERQRVNQSRQP